jgi:hypothetical protein
MLSLRMIIFAGIAGICLWGLFSLLDTLKEPALLRTAQGIAVKGCGTLDEHDAAPKLCPAFLCQKALVDRKIVTLEDRVEIIGDTTDGADRVIAGRLVDKPVEFECVVRGVTVTQAALIDPAA